MSIFNAPRSHGGLATSPDFSGSSGAAAAARQRPSLGWESADDPWTASSHAAAAAVPPASTSSVRPRPVTWTPAPRNAEAGRTSPEESTQQTQLPALYESAWRAAGARQPGDEISIGQLHRIVASSSLGAGVIEAIVNLACDRARCSRSEFALALALVAQAQDGLGLSTSGAQASLERGDAPIPTLALDSLPPISTLVMPTYAREDEEAWPAARARSPDGGRSIAGLPHTTSGFASLRAGSGWTFPSGAAPGSGGASASMVGGYDGLVNSESQHGFASTPGLGNSRFLDSTSAISESAAPNGSVLQADAGASAHPAEVASLKSSLPADEVTVRLKAELGGFWLFFVKHSLYTVSSRLRASSVTRRYSDFVWLADCLVRKYPFRTLPTLPPKRLALPIGARHLSADDAFVEQRRRGLQRYLKALVSHPVLRDDPLVGIFFMEAQPLSDWRASVASPNLEEEGLVAKLSETTIQSIPSDLEAKLARTRAATGAMVERWIGLVGIFERMAKRTEAASADHARLALAISSLNETSEGTWRPESETRRATQECLQRVAMAENDFADLAGARAQAMAVETLEGLKYQRDLWLSWRDLLARHDKLSPDNVYALRKRIEVSAKRFTALRQEKAAGWEAECAKLRAALEADQALVEKLLRRRTHTRHALWEEMNRLHWQTRLVEAEWRVHARREAIHLAATRRAAEELSLVLDSLA